MRPFTVELQLVDLSNDQPTECLHSMNVRASLVLESSKPIPVQAGAEALLLGETEALLVNGKGALKLQMGKDALSSKLGRERLRIKIEPGDSRLQEFPMLTVHSEPLRSVTKLERRPSSEVDHSSPPFGGWPSAKSPRSSRSDGEAASPRRHMELACASALGPDPACSSGPLMGEAYALPGMGPEGVPFAHPVGLVDGAFGGGMGDPSLLSLDAASSGDIQMLKVQLAAERDNYKSMVMGLHKQLQDEHSENLSIKQVLQRQQYQMQELVRQNEAILREVAELRQSIAGHSTSSSSAPV